MVNAVLEVVTLLTLPKVMVGDGFIVKLSVCAIGTAVGVPQLVITTNRTPIAVVGLMKKFKAAPVPASVSETA